MHVLRGAGGASPAAGNQCTAWWRPELAGSAQGSGKRPGRYIAGAVTDLGQNQLFPWTAVTDSTRELLPLKALR